ncbi:C-C motif chemokine 17 [Columba livia]|uniref:C-C motif chemokine n=1 Tax=Columba livia TaxID=8932 RepID=A0A2I0LPP1_COLLI|nr:C-C motif chemokine 17 [Columba livia]PKK19406.1 chemokine (C-C motif) ligand 17 [Columba livia]
MLTARTALVLTALLTLSLCCDAAPSSPSECCYDYRNSRLPLAKLKGYYIAPPECFDPAIVFVVGNGTMVCAHPETDWVKKAVKYLEKKKGRRAS